MPFSTFPQNLKQQQDEKNSHRRDGGHSPHSRNDGNNYFNGHFKSILMNCPYPYTQVTAMEEHYSYLVKRAKTRKEREEVMRGWAYLKGLLIKYFTVLIILFSLSSCTGILYKRDSCGNRPVLVKGHVHEHNLSR
jgi:hypothetical protein